MANSLKRFKFRHPHSAIDRRKCAPPGTKLIVTSQELAESLGKPWRLIGETAYAVGKELDLRIRKVKNGEVHFCKKSL
jgi:hypothetical protein